MLDPPDGTPPHTHPASHVYAQASMAHRKHAHHAYIISMGKNKIYMCAPLLRESCAPVQAGKGGSATPATGAHMLTISRLRVPSMITPSEPSATQVQKLRGVELGRRST